MCVCVCILSICVWCSGGVKKYIIYICIYETRSAHPRTLTTCESRVAKSALFRNVKTLAARENFDFFSDDLAFVFDTARANQLLKRTRGRACACIIVVYTLCTIYREAGAMGHTMCVPRRNSFFLLFFFWWLLFFPPRKLYAYHTEAFTRSVRKATVRTVFPTIE